MTDSELSQFMKRYEQFKTSNLPTPFWDDERQVLEYVYYDEASIASKLEDNPLYDNKIVVDTDIVNALSVIVRTGFYYAYSCKYFTWVDEEISVHIGHTHAHSFADVVRDLYDFPESFSISEEEEEFFSNQELSFLKRVQAYLLFIGLKDKEVVEEDNGRFCNELQRKYASSILKYYDKDFIADVISGKKRIVARKKEDYDTKIELEKYRVLVIDDTYKICLWIEFNNRVIREYQSIKDEVVIDNLEDDDLVVVSDIQVLEKY